MIDIDAPNSDRLFKLFGINGMSDRNEAVDAYLDARRRFDAFARLDSPELPEEDWDRPQVQVYRWQVANFDSQAPYLFALGVTEEFGELAAAQKREDVIDAIGDAMVFACNMATARRLAMSALAHESSFMMNVPQESGVAVGLLSHVTLKEDQRIRGMDNPELARFGTYLALVAVVDELRRFDADPWECFVETAAKVIQRNWKSNAVTGGAA